jgi:hypothetical protein
VHQIHSSGRRDSSLTPPDPVAVPSPQANDLKWPQSTLWQTRRGWESGNATASISHSPASEKAARHRCRQFHCGISEIPERHRSSRYSTPRKRAGRHIPARLDNKANPVRASAAVNLFPIRINRVEKSAPIIGWKIPNRRTVRRIAPSKWKTNQLLEFAKLDTKCAGATPIGPSDPAGVGGQPAGGVSRPAPRARSRRVRRILRPARIRACARRPRPAGSPRRCRQTRPDQIRPAG